MITALVSAIELDTENDSYDPSLDALSLAEVESHNHSYLMNPWDRTDGRSYADVVKGKKAPTPAPKKGGAASESEDDDDDDDDEGDDDDGDDDDGDDDGEDDGDDDGEDDEEPVKKPKAPVKKPIAVKPKKTEA